jgi:UDP-2-acetamido-2,6-beta-L-arabino-hexul-4-ose reductase
MKILVTGARGFVGENLVHSLASKGYNDIFEYDTDNTPEDLDRFCRECEFVFHLAGVNRPKDEQEFMTGNFGFTATLLDMLRKHNNKSPVLKTSSVHAVFDSPYGKSKKAGEDLLFVYGRANDVKTLVYRLPNVFGKWSRPNYNSVVATFCHNIANGLNITVNDPNVDMKLVYIDDVVGEFINALEGRENRVGSLCAVPTVFEVKLGKIVELLYSFKESRDGLTVPCQCDEFCKKLYATYLSYLPRDGFSYPLKMNVDERGS